MTSAPVTPVRVSTIELFFDLVFVFTITQVTTIVVRDPSAAGVGKAAVELSLIFWMYGGFAWLTNTNEPHTLARRGVLLIAMASFLVMSLAVPTGFTSGGLTFAVAYLAVMTVHAIGFLVFAGRGALVGLRMFLPFNLIAATLVLVADFAHGTAVPVLWTLAACIEVVTPFVTHLQQSFRKSAAHFGERHGLIIIIVLGESLLGVASSSQSERVSARLILGALSGLVVLAAMWCCYFLGDDERAVEAMESAPDEGSAMLAIKGYFLAHYLMILGVLLLAAGARLSARDLLAAGSSSGSWLIALGGAAFLLGSAGFRWALRFAGPVGRTLAAAGCLATQPVGDRGSVALQLVAVAVVIAAVLMAELKAR
jgi:low temperature requirement protein LtrA